MVEGELLLVELTDPEDEIGRQTLALYESAFPLEERDPLDVVTAGIRGRAAGGAGTVRHFLAGVRGREVVGLTRYDYYGRLRLAFLSYMAVRTAERGQGLGAWLLAQTLAGACADAAHLGAPPALGLCWEVERPQDAEDEGERSVRERRINFYRRNGAELIEGYSFYAPPLGEGLPSVPYHVMYLPAPGVAQPARPALLAAMVDAILLHGYDLRPDSPYYRDAREALAAISA